MSTLELLTWDVGDSVISIFPVQRTVGKNFGLRCLGLQSHLHNLL